MPSMSTAEGLAEAIGVTVRTQRQARSWTLDQLAERAGVSRRVLVTIEQGSSNPSIATLLRISDALGIGLPALVADGGQAAADVTRAADRPALWSSPAGGAALLAAGTSPPDVVELWDWTLGPGDDYRSEPHSRGTWELLTVLDGVVVVFVAGRDHDLGPGDAVRFRGDVAHGYRNPDLRSPARFALTVFQPGVGEEGSARARS